MIGSGDCEDLTYPFEAEMKEADSLSELVQASTKLRHWLKLLHSQPAAPSLADHHLKPGTQQQSSHQQQQRDKAASKGIVISAGGKDMMANALVTAQVREKRSVHINVCLLSPLRCTRPAKAHVDVECFLNICYCMLN